jgi:hypothetical protein
MLTVTPIMGATGIYLYDTKSFGDSSIIGSILIMAVFGLITVQVWVTYLPAIIFTPVVLEKISRKESFYKIQYWKFLCVSILGGIGVGVFIMLPFIILPWCINI